MYTPKWVTDGIFYQIFPDRFAKSEHVQQNGLHFEPWDSAPTIYGFKGGNLRGVTEHLDYLKDLGINAIYFTPVFASASNHRYHTYDYYNVDPILGGNEALQELLNKAHKNNMHVVLDGVFNHASRGLWQFHHVLETGAASPYKDWFHFDPDRLDGKRPWGAYPDAEELKALKHGEDSFSAIGYKAWWNLPALPKFNTDLPAVREFIFEVAEHWIKFGIDGWRLDVPGEIDDDSFWQEFRSRVRAINPEAYIVGEIWQDARRWLQGDQFDAVMNYLVTSACLSFFTGKYLDIHATHQAGGFKDNVHSIDVHQFADRIDSILEMYHPDVTRVQLNLLDSHDSPRFLTCASGDLASLQLALTFIFTYPGAPCIFYGDEIGLDGRHDPECRKSFPWDESKWNHKLRGFVKELITLRKTHESLRWGKYQRLYSAEGVYAFKRSSEDETLIIALNAAEEARSFEIAAADLGRGRKQILFGQAEIQKEDGIRRLTIPPRSGIVFK